MRQKLFGIIICMLLFMTVLPLSGTVIVEKNAIPPPYDGSLSGYVNDTFMNPIEGALVGVYFHEAYRENYTDSYGYYHVTNIPICYCLKNCTASKEGYNPDWVWMGITDNTTYDFVLTPLNLPRLGSPYGPTDGVVDVDYTFYFDLPDDPECEPYFVMWDWGDGTMSELIGPYVSGETVCAGHSWNEPGDYDIRVKIRDGCGNDDWSDPLTIHIILNSPPNTPVIEGPEEVWVGVEYTFYITFEDPEGDDIFFYIDWGDGTHSDWMGPYLSGVTVSFTHYWTEAGTYVIRIKAKDVFGEESGWSEFIIRVIPPPRFFRHMKISGMLKTRPWRGLILSVINFDRATVTEGISGNVQLEPFTCHNYKFVALALNVHSYDKETLYINASTPFMILIGY